VVVISFHQLIGDGGKDGARETFERLTAQLVRLQFRAVKRVEANPGDWGIDVLVGEIDGVISVWQAKFFIDGFAKPQQAQVRESFAQIVAQAAKQGFTVDAWTLCIPVDLDAESLKWWTTWTKKQERETGIGIQLWDRTELEGVLLTLDAADIRAAFFPTTVVVPAGAVAPLAVVDVPPDVTYEDMLFIKQLEAAEIREHDSAKQQFFNAELLGREVADKRVTEHVLALQAERADLRSIWEDRYNQACRTSGGHLLPTLHAEVMQAIEHRHDGAGVQVLPMHLVHRKGAMHQVVEAGRAGWVRGFRAIAAGHHG
jgi:hypothetical protein